MNRLYRSYPFYEHLAQLLAMPREVMIAAGYDDQLFGVTGCVEFFRASQRRPGIVVAVDDEQGAWGNFVDLVERLENLRPTRKFGALNVSGVMPRSQGAKVLSMTSAG